MTSMLFPASMLCAFLCFQLSQVFVQPAHAVFPGPAVLFDPGSNLAQGSTPQAAWPSLCIATATDQARALQNLEVFGHGRRSDRKRLGELFDGQVACCEAGQDSSPGRVRESRKRRAELIRQLIHHVAN
jgi:hypothetical protein